MSLRCLFGYHKLALTGRVVSRGGWCSAIYEAKCARCGGTFAVEASSGYEVARRWTVSQEALAVECGKMKEPTP